jgi:Transglycosylase SLT domain
MPTTASQAQAWRSDGPYVPRAPQTPTRHAATQRAGRIQANLAPGMQCRTAIREAEQAAGVPTQLMAAIGRVESGRPDENGVIQPWPWTINAEGVGHIFETKAEAIAAVQMLQTKGLRSVDVGCMQVNLMHHPTAFATLDQAFDPAINAGYAASFLIQLHAMTGDWSRATAFYHSATPELGTDYARKVAAVLPDEQRRGPEAARVLLHRRLADAWAVTLDGQPGARDGRAAANVRVVSLPSVGVIGRNLDVYGTANAGVRPIAYKSR